MMQGYILGQATSDLMDVVGEISLPVAAILFLLGVILMAMGWFNVDGGNIKAGILGIIGGAGIAFTFPIMKGFYQKAGMEKAIPKVEYRIDSKILFTNQDPIYLHIQAIQNKQGV